MYVHVRLSVSISFLMLGHETNFQITNYVDDFHLRLLSLSLSTLLFSLLFSFAMFCMLFFYLLNGNIRQHNSIIVGMSMGMSVDLYYSSTVSFRLSFLFLSMSVCVCK